MTNSKRRTAQTVVSTRIPSRRTALAGAVSLALASSAAMAAYPMNIEPYGKLASEVSSAGVEAVLPLVQSNGSLLFVDGKAAIGTDEYWKINVGLAYRQQTADKQWQWGVYGAYDYQNSENDNGFGGATFGGEVRSERFDFRANYYYPISDEELVRTTNVFNKFQGYGIYTDGVYDEAMEGFDVEAGARLDIFSTVQTRAFLKGFWYDGEVVPDNSGWQASLELRPQKNLIIEAGYRDDDIYDSQGFLLVKYAFGQSSDKGNLTLDERMVEPWRREDSVIWSGYQSRDARYAVRVYNGLTHIDSSAPAGGDGSYERPYADSTQCLAVGGTCSGSNADTILLWQGESLYVPYTPVVLREGQTLWGQGYDLLADRGIVGLSDKYDFGPDMMPVIDPASGVKDINDVGAGVVLARNTSVYGVAIGGGVGYYENSWYLLPGDGDGIVSGWGEGEEGGDIVIRGNEIVVTGDGIRIEDYNNGGSTTTVGIFENYIETVGTYYHSDVPAGIRLSNEAAYYGESTQLVTIADNTVFARHAGISILNEASYGGSAMQDVSVANSLIVSGVYAQAEAAEAATVSDVIALRREIEVAISAYNGAESAPRTAIQTITLTGNTLVGLEGVSLGNRAGPEGTATQGVTVDDNLIYGKYTGLSVRNLAFGESAVAGQTVTGAGNAIYAEFTGVALNNTASAGGAATQTVSLSDNDIYAYGAGIVIFNEDLGDVFTPSAVQTVTLTDNTIVGGGESDPMMSAEGAAVQQIWMGPYEGGALMAENVAYGYYADATQTLNLSGNTFVGQGNFEPVPAMIPVGGNALTLGNRASAGGHAEQTTNLSDNTVVSDYGTGLIAENVDDDGEIDNTAVQRITFSGTNTFEAGHDGIQFNNRAAEDGDAYQYVTFFDGSTTSITAADHGIHVHNTAEEYGYAYQRIDGGEGVITISGVNGGILATNDARYSAYASQHIDFGGSASITSSEGFGVQMSNDAGGDYSDAYQTLILVGGSISAYGTAINAANHAGYDGDAGQTIELSGMTVTSENGSGVVLSNVADDKYATSTQSVSVTNGSITASDDALVASNVSSYNAVSSKYGSSAQQTITLDGASLTSLTGDGAVMANTASGSYAGASQGLSAVNGGGVSAYGDGLILSNVASGISSDASQEVLLSGLSAGIGATSGSGAILANTASATNSYASQSLAVTNTSVAGGVIDADQDGIVAGNTAIYYSDALQSITLSGVSVDVADGQGVVLGNTAATSSYALQAFGASHVDGSIDAFGEGILAGNLAGVASEAVQTLTLSGMSVSSVEDDAVLLANTASGATSTASQSTTVSNGTLSTPVGNGVELSNTGSGTDSVAGQSFSLTGESGINAFDEAVLASNTAANANAEATQAIVVGDATLTSGSTDAILLVNSATGAAAVADQTFAATDAAIDGLEGGVVMVNTGVAGITNASQKFNQEGGTINSGTGYFAVNATNNGVLAAQNVAVSGVAVNGDGVGLGVQLTSSGTDLTAVQSLNLNTGTLNSDDVGVVVTHTGGTQIASIANQTLMADGSYVVLANGASEDQKTFANTNVVNKPYFNQGTGYMLVDITEVPPGTSYDPNTP